MGKQPNKDTQSKTRFANGIISAIIVCFFAVHGLLGGIALAFGFSNSIAWIVWVGVGIVVLHVLVSIATSYQQMTDAAFPPSPRKKRHLVLKWTTGILLAAAICVHIACTCSPALVEAMPALPTLATVMLTAVLAVHICVGAKSLLTDINLDKGLMTPLRAMVCVFAAIVAAMAVIGFVK